MPIDFPTAKYADPTTFPPASPASTDAVMARTSGGADKSFVLGNLAGLAPLVVTADQSAYYTGTAWAAYTVTSVGRTLLAAATLAAQRSALATGTASSASFFRGDGTWATDLEGSFTLMGVSGGTRSFKIGAGRTADGFSSFDLVSDSTYTNYGFRMSRAGGANGATVLTSRGTGGYSLTTEEQGGIVLRTNNTVALQISGFTQNVTWYTTLLPAVDNTSDIGTGAVRVRTYYGVNSAINTSDARAKTEPRQLRQAEVAAFAQIARLPAIWRWLSRVNGDGCEPEGREARKHGGPTVQAAMAIMEAHGLAPMEYACFCHDEWEAQPEQWHEWAEELTEDGEVIREAGRELLQEAVEAGDRYSFRKEELLCLIVAAMAAQHDALEARVAALEAGRTP